MEIINGERLVLGTCYYPEHWDESLWRDDLRRMLENGSESQSLHGVRLSGTREYLIMISLIDFWIWQKRWG